jgi:hypothetical protein
MKVKELIDNLQAFDPEIDVEVAAMIDMPLNSMSFEETGESIRLANPERRFPISTARVMTMMSPRQDIAILGFEILPEYQVTPDEPTTEHIN